MLQESLAHDIERLKIQTQDQKDEVKFHREQYVQASKSLSPGWFSRL